MQVRRTWRERKTARCGSGDARGVEKHTRGVAQRARGCHKKHTPVLRMAETTRVDAFGRWRLPRPTRKAAFVGWLLRSRWQISAGFHLADDRHSRAGCGCEE